MQQELQNALNRPVSALVVLLLFKVGATLAFGEKVVIPQPGQETEWQFQVGLKQPLRLFLPEDYDPSKTWPVVFHYHGTGGEPTTNIPKTYTNKNGFVIVGMEYFTENRAPIARDYLDDELNLLKEVREELAQHVSIDPLRTIVGGFSKGGWFASEFAEAAGKEFAGAYVLGAGKYFRDKRPVQKTSKEFALYIGIGQFDPNNPYSHQAIRHFERLGATVSFEEFPGLGHSLPMGQDRAEYFMQWWQILRDGPDAHRGRAFAWAKELLQSQAQEADPLRRYLPLEFSIHAPYFDLLGEKESSFFRKKLEAAKQSLPKSELLAAQSYWENQSREAANLDYWTFDEIGRRELELATRYAETYYGNRATVDYHHLYDVISNPSPTQFPDPERRNAYLQKISANPMREPINSQPMSYFQQFFR